MKIKKLLLAGSHAATPAYAVIQEIKRRKLPWEIYFVGKKWATEDKKVETLEYGELPKLGTKFYELESGRLQTKFTRYTLWALLKVPFGFVQSLILILKIKPDLVLTFGGASGAQISFWSRIFKIPVIVHEQTSSAGRANIFSSKFARKIAISRESSRMFFPKDKTILTGNPLTEDIINVAKEKPRDLPKTILITGGSRGSEWINKAIAPILPILIKRYNVVHLTGKGEGRLSIPEMATAMSSSDIIVSRAGANTVSEIIALKKPSILIPIPWVYNDEQTKNAQYAEDFGVARILQQKELTPQRLEIEIENLSKDYTEIIKRIRDKVSPDLDASEKVVDILEEFI